MSLTTAPQTASGESKQSMSIHVYNTLTRNKEPFQPVTPGKVGIYLCGPTVYDKAHIGHMVGPVIFDTIKKYFTYSGYDVTLVVNITDVDDKLIAKANERGLEMSQVAEEMTEDYLQNLAAFGIDSIDEMPRATKSMGDIIRFVEQLIDKGFAYEAEGDVYFEVTKDNTYGKLSNRTTENMLGEGGETVAIKRSPADFALWKSAKEGEPGWDSPWGSGRPGWHIECSAMSRAILGETFDIHGGGLDLVFPHHENELAQSECCHGKPMATYWMHNGLMRASSATGKVGGRGERDGAEPEQADVNTKISRSKGAGGLADLIAKQGGERIRFFLLRTHYRSTIVFSEEGIEEAGKGLDGFYRFFERYERITGDNFYDIEVATSRDTGQFDAGSPALLTEVAAQREAFLSDMDDDFNTGAAVSRLFELAKILNKFVETEKLEENKSNADAIAALKQGTSTLRELAVVLGLFRTPVAQDAGADDQLVDGLMKLIIQLRADARERKDYATSDQVRDGLAELGLVLEDRKGETGWRKE